MDIDFLAVILKKLRTDQPPPDFCSWELAVDAYFQFLSAGITISISSPLIVH